MGKRRWIGAHFGKIQIGRPLRTLWAFVMVLSWSRAIFLRFYVSAAMPSFLRGHVDQGNPVRVTSASTDRASQRLDIAWFWETAARALARSSVAALRCAADSM